MAFFITNIRNKYHTIDLTDSKKHLIITGKNGSGKTTLLKAIRNQMIELENFSDKKKHSKYVEIEKIINLIDISINHASVSELIEVLKNSSNTKINKMKRFININFNIGTDYILDKRIFNNGYVLAYFDSKRTFAFESPNGITIADERKYSINDRAGKYFIQYLINLKAERAFSYQEGRMESVRRIDDWFINFQNNLKDLFETEELELIFERTNFSFKVKMKDETVDLLHLSDGFSSILFIISEIIMRMKNKGRFKAEGIVIIDELETHLHVSLQKKILRFLINFFPNIQFIVSTHSPFIINSISNSVTYDMETKQHITDMSGYSYESIVEDYFNIDQYSDSIKEYFNEYTLLTSTINKTPDEKKRFEELESYLQNIPDYAAPGLKYKYNELKLKRKSDLVD